MIDFFVTFDYLCSFKNSYEYLVLPQKLPHIFSSVASVWQHLNKCCNDELYCLSFFSFSKYPCLKNDCRYSFKIFI